MTGDDLIGTRLDEYQLEVLLGEGGMARVYRGRDLNLQRLAAIKVISPTFRQEQDYLERFEREARAIALLEHPHIVRLYRYGETNGLIYMAMQLIEGSDLGNVLQSYRQSNEYIEFPEAIRLIHEIGAALDYVHAQGIIHRDVKPSNIMLDRAGKAYLADFGLVLLTQIGTRGEIFGSPHYLAPEQAISSAKAVPQSDLYSLGVIAWEMFTGQVPFDSQDPLDIAMQHISQEPPLPRTLRSELSPALEAVLLKALAKKPEDRYASGAALADAIEDALAMPIATTSPIPSAGKTIPERVALDMANWPLPPIPAAAIAPAAPSGSNNQAFADQPSALPASSGAIALPPKAPVAPSLISRRLLPILFIAGIFGICILAACLIVFSLGKAGFSGFQANAVGSTPAPGSTEMAIPFSAVPSSTESAAPTTTLPSAALTPGILPTAASSPTLPEPSPTPAIDLVTLVMIRCREGHCMGFINQSQATLPLAPLTIQGKGYSYTGTDWGLTSLPPGGCLVLTSNDKLLPSQAECSSITATLISTEDFWKKNLDISYNGTASGRCSEKSDYCEFIISIK